ncbi:hypothetical protein ACIQUY_29335 [Streptomyces sp. NPDC090231]|uniref:hypothetical protein n=1 Tax=unclassified Streptomyces TaxID=2593676 RepID=UPI00381465DA
MKALRKVWAEAAAPINAERDLLRAVRTGSGALVARLWHWIYSADGMDSLWYALVTVWALAALGWGVTQAWWIAPVLGLVWLLAALRLGGTPPPEKINNDVGESDESAPDDSPEPPTADEFVLQLAELIGTRNGVLLATAVEHFREAGAPAGWGIPEARAQCSALGIPVRSIKVAGSTSIGVHRDGLRAALDAGLQAPAGPSPEAAPDPLAKSGQPGG